MFLSLKRILTPTSTLLFLWTFSSRLRVGETSNPRSENAAAPTPAGLDPGHHEMAEQGNLSQCRGDFASNSGTYWSITSLMYLSPFFFDWACVVESSLMRSWSSGRILASWCYATPPTGLRMRTSTATTTASARCRFRTRYMRALILTSRLVIMVFNSTTNAAAFAQNGRLNNTYLYLYC